MIAFADPAMASWVEEVSAGCLHVTKNGGVDGFCAALLRFGHDKVSRGVYARPGRTYTSRLCLGAMVQSERGVGTSLDGAAVPSAQGAARHDLSLRVGGTMLMLPHRLC